MNEEALEESLIKPSILRCLRACDDSATCFTPAKEDCDVESATLSFPSRYSKSYCGDKIVEDIKIDLLSKEVLLEEPEGLFPDTTLVTATGGHDSPENASLTPGEALLGLGLRRWI